MPKNQTKSYIFNIYIYEEDLALNNLQWLVCHKTKPNQLSKEQKLQKELKRNQNEYYTKMQETFKITQKQ